MTFFALGFCRGVYKPWEVFLRFKRKLLVENITNHIWGLRGARDMAISIFGRTLRSLALARTRSPSLARPSLARPLARSNT